MSETSGQKVSCSTRSLSALTPVTMKPSNFWCRMSRERFVELADVIGGRIPGVTPSRYAAHVRVGRDEGEVHLQHRVAEPKGELAFGRDLVRHQVDDRDLQRTDVLLFGAAAVDRQRAAERRQEGVDFVAMDDDGHF